MDFDEARELGIRLAYECRNSNGSVDWPRLMDRLLNMICAVCCAAAAAERGGNAWRQVAPDVWERDNISVCKKHGELFPWCVYRDGKRLGPRHATAEMARSWADAEQLDTSVQIGQKCTK